MDFPTASSASAGLRSSASTVRAVAEAMPSAAIRRTTDAATRASPVTSRPIALSLTRWREHVSPADPSRPWRRDVTRPPRHASGQGCGSGSPPRCASPRRARCRRSPRSCARRGGFGRTRARTVRGPSSHPPACAGRGLRARTTGRVPARLGFQFCELHRTCQP